MKASKTSKKKILKKYIKYVGIKGKRPNSIQKFCTKSCISENDFYDNFRTFVEIETFFWKQLFRATNKALSHEKFENHTHHLLSFYYTLIENLNLNKGFVYFTERNSKSTLCIAKQLKKVSKDSLMNFSTGNSSLLDKLPGDFSSSIKLEVLTIQLLSIYHFWKNDRSEDQEETDAFVEKSVKLSHDLSNAFPTESIFDYGKFIYKNLKHFA
jgi:hypothetical protein